MLEIAKSTHVMLTPSTISRLKELGGTLRNAIELLSFTQDTTRQLQLRKAFLNPSSVEPAQPKPAEAPKATGRPRTKPLTIDEMQAEKAQELMSYGYSREVAENMSNANIARCEAEIAEGRSPKQLADLKAQWE